MLDTDMLQRRLAVVVDLVIDRMLMNGYYLLNSFDSSMFAYSIDWLEEIYYVEDYEQMLIN